MTRFVGDPSPFIGLGCLATTCIIVSLTRVFKIAQPPSDRLASLDGLRGVLAFGVFLTHFFATYNWKHNGIWYPVTNFYSILGQFSVVIFFIITGFLFFGKMSQSRSHFDFNTLFVGRIFRLFPVYLISEVISCALFFIAYPTQPTSDLQNALTRIILFQPIYINGSETSVLVNAGVSWSLKYEFLFYLFMPVIWFLWRILRFETWPLFLLTVGLLWLGKDVTDLPWISFGPSTFAPILLGGLVNEIGRSRHMRKFAVSIWGTVTTIASVVLVYLTCQTAYSVPAYTILAVSFAQVAYGNDLLGLLKWRPLLFLGEISYDIYLSHGIVLFVTFTLLMPDSMIRAASSGRLFSLIEIAGCGTVLVSTALHLFVEKPMLELGRRLVSIDRVQELGAP